MTIVLIVVLSAHPELRLFLPLIDVLGLDLLLILMGSQFMDYVRPFFYLLRPYFLPPYAVRVHFLFLLFVFNIGLHNQHRPAE